MDTAEVDIDQNTADLRAEETARAVERCDSTV